MKRIAMLILVLSLVAPSSAFALTAKQVRRRVRVEQVRLKMSPAEIVACNKIIARESGWRYLCWGGAGRSYYGLGQLNRSMWRGWWWRNKHRPEVQMRRIHKYVRHRYGSFRVAWSFWQSHGWY